MQEYVDGRLAQPVVRLSICCLPQCAVIGECNSVLHYSFVQTVHYAGELSANCSTFTEAVPVWTTGNISIVPACDREQMFVPVYSTTHGPMHLMHYDATLSRLWRCADV